MTGSVDITAYKHPIQCNNNVSFDIPCGVYRVEAVFVVQACNSKDQPVKTTTGIIVT